MADEQPSQPRPQRAEQSQPRPSRRREKPQLSCTLCRRRKLRCDRGEPCGTCVRRGLGGSCVYVRSSVQGSQPPPPEASSVTDRINQLERLLTSLVEGNKSSPHPEANGVSPARSMLPPSPMRPASGDASCRVADSGCIRVENNSSTYVPGTHWTAIMDQVTELKNMLSNDCGSTDRRASYASALGMEHGEPDLLFGGHNGISSQEIITAVPPKSVVDRMVAGFFLDRPIIPVVLHGPTFLIEYERFWDNPLGTSLIWIGLLFAVMYLVVSYRPEVVPMVSDPAGLAQAYREKIAQCLSLGRYTKGSPHSIETLLLYLNIELLRREDAQIEPWMLLGMTVRLAYRMGYHRDARHFPHISTFQGEMRRRIWALIVQLDISTSAQVGLPRMTHDDQADTAEPRNLLDEDLHHDMQELPLSRPSAVQTEIQYTLLQTRLTSVCGRVFDWVGALSTRRTNFPFAEADLARLDRQLDDTYAAFPETLRMRPMSKSLVDNAETVLRRMSLYLQLQGAKCLLHYHFSSLFPSILQGEQPSSHHTSSRGISIQAALQILQCQQILYEETQVSGRLYKDRWRVSSLLRGPCFLATAVLCSEVDGEHSRPQSSREDGGHMMATADNIIMTNPAPMTQPQHGVRARIIQSLHECCLVWTHLSETSSEALKAAEAVRAVLNKIHNTTVDISPTADTRSIPDLTMTTSNMVPYDNLTASSSKDQGTRNLVSSVQHDSNAQHLNDLPHYPGYNQNSQMEYDPLSPSEINRSQRVDQLQRINKYFPKKFAFPI